MNLLDLMVKIGVDDQVTGRLSGIADGAKGIAGGIAQAGAAVAGVTAAAGVAVGAMGQQAIEAYASYEQLEGGVRKLYGTGSQTLEEYAAETGLAGEELAAAWGKANQGAWDMMENAQNAYKTAGMSANEYMETATSFSASLINSLSGDTAEAARVTDVAMRAMSDNVNTFGSNAEDVKNAIMGISRENYTMVDNLKLGYAGTKEGMQNLIDDANAYAESIDQAGDLQMGNFADMIQAIELIQEKQGIAGTTAKEAATTIEGSIAMTKAAWTNLLTEFGKDDGDVGARVEELVESAKTALLGSVDEATGEVQGGIIPRVQQVMQAVADELPNAVPMLMQVGGEVFQSVIQVVVDMSPVLLQAVVQALQDVAATIVEHKSEIAEGAIQFFIGVTEALAAVAPDIIGAIIQLVAELVAKVIEHAPDMLAAAGRLLLGLLQGIAEGIAPMVQGMNDVVQGGLDAVGNFVKDMFDAGASLIQGLIDGIASAPGKVAEAVTGAVGGAIDGAKQLLGIASPSKVFRGIGENTMLGLEQGLLGGSKGVRRAMDGIMGSLAASPSMALGIAGAGLGGAYVDNRTYYVGDVSYLPDSAIAAGIEGLVDELQAELRMG